MVREESLGQLPSERAGPLWSHWFLDAVLWLGHRQQRPRLGKREEVGRPFRVEHAGVSKFGVLIAWSFPEPGYFGAASGCLAAWLAGFP